MKKIPIKFRGKPTLSSEYIYGDYVTRQDGCCAIRFKENENLFNMHEYEVAVKPETVAQLVGYDAEGKEIYEGDKVFDADNSAVTAVLYPNAHYKNYTLKRK